MKYYYAFNSVLCAAPRWLRKTFLVMKMTTLILLTFFLQLSGNTMAQRVTINGNDMSLIQTFREIKRQTGFTVLIGSEELRKSRSLKLEINDVELTTALKIILEPENLSFTVKDKAIVVKQKEAGKPAVAQAEKNFTDVIGMVADERGAPLPGASIVVKGSSKKTVSNTKGEFSITGLTPDDVLVVNFIGYKQKEVKVGSAKTLIIQMEQSLLDLQEVAVVSTGYQNLPKERATGSFKVISQEQLDKPGTNLAQRLVGTVAGMAATTDANGGTTFRVRGQTSLSAGSDPLVVVDGFPIQGTFDNINPNNIESVTILKDAAAASIWGARSGNGVIVVTTKSGKKGIPFSADITAFTRIANKVDLSYARPFASSAETIEFEKLAYGKWVPLVNNGGLLAQVGVGPWSEGITQMNEYALGRITLQQRDTELARLSSLDNRQQIKDLILDNPISNQINLNLSGSTSGANHALSMLYETNSTNFRGTDNEKSLLNYRMDADVFKWLKLDLALMFQYGTANRNGMTLEDIQSWSPYDMLVNENGTNTNFPYGYYMPTLNLLVPQQKFPYDFYYNPIREINSRNFTTENLNGRIQTGITAKILKGLSISSRVQYENFNTFNRNLYGEDSFVVRNSINSTASWDRTATGVVTLNLPKGAQLDQDRSKITGYTFRNQINYNNLFHEDHAINVIAGAEIRSSVIETFINPRTYGYNDQTLAVGQFPNGPGGTGTGRAITTWLGVNQTFNYTNSFGYSTDRYFSSFANMSYTYKSKYTLSGSFRTDASNLIAANPSSRYSPFWSVGGSWQASREAFLKHVKWIDKLTARITYGYNGNEDRSTSPMPLITLSATPNANTGATTATVTNFGNPTLRWEKTGTVNAGLDFSIFKGKFFGSVDFYDKRGKDLLAEIAIPVVNGTSSQRLNNVEMYNKGIEFDLGSRIGIARGISWTGNVTFAYNQNKITKLFRTQYTASALVGTGTSRYVEGLNANSIWSFHYAGLSNGSPVYAGPNGSLINFGQNSTAEARDWLTNSGVTVAPYTLGTVNSFDIYNFNLSFIITGKFGHVFRRSSFNYPFQNGGRLLPNARLSEILTGDPNSILTLPTNNNDATYRTWTSQYQYLDYLIESANHLRLQEVSLSYNLRAGLMKKLHLNALRLYAQANDLVTVMNNTYKEDPEYRLGTLNPRARITFGFKLQL